MKLWFPENEKWRKVRETPGVSIIQNSSINHNTKVFPQTRLNQFKLSLITSCSWFSLYWSFLLTKVTYFKFVFQFVALDTIRIQMNRISFFNMKFLLCKVVLFSSTYWDMTCGLSCSRKVGFGIKILKLLPPPFSF